MADYPAKALGKGGAVLQNLYRLISRTRDALLSVWSYRTVRIILGTVFIGSGTAKLLNPLPFTVIIEAFGMIPESWITPVTVIIPALEVIGGIGLLLDIYGSLALITTMLALFMLILIYGIWMGLDIDCGCFGPGDPEAEAFHGLRPALYRDIVMKRLGFRVSGS
ncbi:MAG: DoxX family membrane protein, partial [Deltaproteobacteria bacterium]|nr:DoxX family membrane protein [Deltaproteobacteria bacterium]